ncbi:Peptidase family M1 [Granulicella rosea]|uniref:Peptidase family M1 n=1 Tax=Granulicella rosea TaxID=474952 RepID=A0A239L235_9BACT|nr:M1 family metallopeptidase [Granulicella rosea]SNT24370.1 Peptidase family M1 [Granulicella rosea]
MRPASLFLALLLSFAAVQTQAQSLATNSSTPLSTRVVAYDLAAKIDTDKKSLDATETLTYKNLTGQPLLIFPFHLYLNAFRPQSTFTSETHFQGGIRDSEADNDYPKEKLGSIVITHIDADGQGDLTPWMSFTAPDDGNQQDHTVMEVKLAHAILPGESITFHMTFHDQFPLSVARNGYKRDFLMGGQWYPKVGVFWHGAWNCHQYHATTEFFSDFGTFNVKLTLPRRYTVGATGVPTGEQTNPGDTKTLSFYAEDVGDFAWAASPHFVVTDGTYLSSMGPVKIHVLALAAHPGAGKRYLDIIHSSLAKFDQFYGPYPYKIVTVIDPEPDSEMGGMEYPTLFTGDTTVWDPTHITEITAEHEFGHQYWYGMVATNEFEDAWLDEGVNSYTENKVMDAIYNRHTSGLDQRWANLGETDLQRTQYLSNPDSDPVVRHAWQFRNSGSYGAITYGKTATLMNTLEGIIGEDTLREALHVYFMRYRFTHPTTEDLLNTIEEVAIKRGRATGQLVTIPNPPATAATPYIQYFQNYWVSTTYKAPPAHPVIINSSLRPFFNQAIYGTQMLDYSVSEPTSDPVEWWKPEPGAGKTQYRDTVTIRRRGEFTLSVTLEVVFEDGTKSREIWDGLDRWHTYTYIRSSRIVSVEIDPQHTVMLDRNLFNNSYTTKADPIPARKLANLYTSALQLLEQMLTWVV